MKLLRRNAALILLLFLAMPIVVSATPYTPTDVVEVPAITDLRTVAVSGTNPTVVNVRGHTAAGDGGAGLFRRNGTSCTDDDGVIIQEASASGSWCWYRQFSGPVHLPWYGVADTTSSACQVDSPPSSCFADQAVFNAFAAAQPSAGLGGDGGVVTDGRSIYIDGGVSGVGVMEILANQYFSCSGPPGGQRPQLTVGAGALPYYNLPNSIVLNPANPIIRDHHSRLEHCIVRPSWYNQSRFFSGSTQLINSTRDIIDNIEHMFSGTGTTCGSVETDGSPGTDGEACDMEDVMILGFDVCDDTANAARAAGGPGRGMHGGRLQAIAAGPARAFPMHRSESGFARLVQGHAPAARLIGGSQV